MQPLSNVDFAPPYRNPLYKLETEASKPKLKLDFECISEYHPPLKFYIQIRPCQKASSLALIKAQNAICKKEHRMHFQWKKNISLYFLRPHDTIKIICNIHKGITFSAFCCYLSLNHARAHNFKTFFANSYAQTALQGSVDVQKRALVSDHYETSGQ